MMSEQQLPDTSSVDGELIDQLRALLDESGLLLGSTVTERGAGIWRSDNIQAQVLVRPKTTEEVSAILKLCNEHGQSVVTHGGLTGLVESALTSPSDLVLSMERMNNIEAINPLERTMVVQSGVILQTVQEAAEEAGLMYPLDLGSRGSCTIGGNIATNAGGNRVIRYGMTRDMILGLEAVMADGTIISSMNQMIKNNAGYDLKQLFIGTEGTLGVITRAVLRCREQVMLKPTALVCVQSFDQLMRFLKHTDAQLAGSLSAFEVMWQNYYQLVTTEPATNTAPLAADYAFYVLIEAMGASDDQLQTLLEAAVEQDLIIDAVIAQSEAQRAQIWNLRDDVEQTFQHAPIFLFDVSLRLPHMEEYVDTVNRNLEAAFAKVVNFPLGHVGDGNLHFAIGVGGDDEETRLKVEACVYEPLAAIEGSVSAEHGVGLEKKRYLGIARSEIEIEMMRHLKRSLDPKLILNAGKIVDC
jgi:FAD/FMN-containing dehydrogenase